MNRVKGLIGQNGIVDFVLILTTEWRLLKKHLVDEDTERPPIDGPSVLLVQKDLETDISISGISGCIMKIKPTSGAMNSGVPQKVLVVQPYHMFSLQRP